MRDNVIFLPTRLPAPARNIAPILTPGDWVSLWCDISKQQLQGCILQVQHHAKTQEQWRCLVLTTFKAVWCFVDEVEKS